MRSTRGLCTKKVFSTPTPCATRRIVIDSCAPPLGDSRVVAREQHLGHVNPPEDRGPGIAGVVQTAARERLALERFRLQSPLQQSYRRVHHGQRRQLSAGDDKVAE